MSDQKKDDEDLKSTYDRVTDVLFPKRKRPRKKPLPSQKEIERDTNKDQLARKRNMKIFVPDEEDEPEVH